MRTPVRSCTSLLLMLLIPPALAPTEARARKDRVPLSGQAIPFVPPAAQVAPATKLITIGEAVITPVRKDIGREEVSQFTSLGSIDVAGYRRVIVSVAGRFGAIPDTPPGEIELLLLPDVGFVNDMLRKERELLLVQAVRLPLREVGNGLFQARGEVELAFPRYRAWMRNRTSGNLRLTLYLLATE